MQPADLLVRDFADRLYRQIKSSRESYVKGGTFKGAILCGNPGIGKSWYLSYMLMRLLRDDKDASVLYMDMVSVVTYMWE